MDIVDIRPMDTWTPIGHTSNQLILYHPPSHALSVQPHAQSEPIAGPSRQRKPLLLGYNGPIAGAGICPYCSQPLPETPRPAAAESVPPRTSYFQVLEQAHEGSRPPSPRLGQRSPTPGPNPDDDDGGAAEPLPSSGYYGRFFREQSRLGMGAEGSVFLATHVIGDNVLGTYAVKKIAVGESKEYLVRMLREVRLLETLRHPNIIPYHHSWIEPTRFSTFGPPINALHVLMMYATAGNLDSFLIARTNSISPSRPDDLSAGCLADGDSLGQLPKAERIKAFKKRRASGVATTTAKREETRAVLLLGFEEILRLFGGVVEGLAFLHANAVLHLDLKCSNVLLHWEEGDLIPKAMISDFGTSEEMLLGKRQRTGHTGTMEYMAPETLVVDSHGAWRPSDSRGDMWSLGMILHRLLFLRMPYPATIDYDDLLVEILRYPGFLPSQGLIQACERRHIPHELLLLLSRLICVDPNRRPSAEKVRAGLKDLKPVSGTTGKIGTIVLGGINSWTRKLGGVQQSPSSEPRTRSPDSPSRTEWEQDWRFTPVRSLPAPDRSTPPTPLRRASLDILETDPGPPPLVQNRLIPAFARYGAELRTAIFVGKIMSLQPAVCGPIPPYIALGLVFLALYDLRRPSGSISAALSAVHLITLLYVA